MATAEKSDSQEYFLVNNKQPGEKEPGKFHFNPGKMSEKPRARPNRMMLEGYAAIRSNETKIKKADDA